MVQMHHSERHQGLGRTRMTASAPTGLSEFLLRLHGLVQEQSVDQFQESALARVRTVLPFDAAMWGNGTLAAAGGDPASPIDAAGG